MKKVLLPILLMASLNAFPGEKGNGGETLDVNGVLRLRDLVEGTTCSWVDGQEVIDENPILNDVLNRLAAVDWYFSYDLKQEILDLNYCLTKKLVKINTNDFGSLITTYNYRAAQVAIRFNRQVYIDTNISSLMPAYDHAFLIVHEAMHTYLSADTFMRNNKVRSQVKAIESVYGGLISSTYAYHVQMRNNDILFPLSAQKLAAKKENVLYFLGNYEVKRAAIMKETSVEGFYKTMKKIDAFDIAPWHRGSLEQATAANMISLAIENDDVEVLQKFLNDSNSMKELTLSMLYSSPIAEGSFKIKELLADGSTVESLTASLFSQMALKELSKNEHGRLMVSGMELLATRGDASTEFTALIALSRDSSSVVHPKLRFFMEMIKKMIESENQALLEKLIHENPAFYQAFNNTIKGQLTQVNTEFALEQTVALRKVDTLLNGFWSLLKKEVTEEIGNNEWAAFAKKIDVKKLGYEIK
jgi:hypothetical protein